MTLMIDEIRLRLRQEELDKEYKESVERANRCTPHSKPKSESIFDNTARDIPVNLYLDCKEYERGDRWHKLGPEYTWGFNYQYVGAFVYHAVTKALPLWLFIMLYW